METKEYRTIDRVAAGWASGEWDSEPDKMQWPDAATGLPCLLVRHPRMGFLCGYVGVPPSHPLHGVDYDHALNGECGVEVHGGLTFAGGCHPGPEDRGICHRPSEGEPDDVWWFGFDCGHAGDYSPQDAGYAATRGYPYMLQPDDEYRNVDYVRSQCTELARQLAAMA